MGALNIILNEFGIIIILIIGIFCFILFCFRLCNSMVYTSLQRYKKEKNKRELIIIQRELNEIGLSADKTQLQIKKLG